MKLQLAYPVKKVQINQAFGENPVYYQTYFNLKSHNGIDFFALNGTEILASHDGVCVYAGLDGSNGNLVVIKTEGVFEYGEIECYFKTLYGHLESSLVTVGDKVKQGQVIAKSDNTGRSSGPHLHFGFKPVQKGEADWQWFNLEQDNGWNGAIDPTPYLPPLATFPNPVQLGDEGFDVAKIQAFLLRHKFLAPLQEGEMGTYGPKTRKAIFNFQLANCNLSLYERTVLRGSKVGPKTLLALNSFEL